MKTIFLFSMAILLYSTGFSQNIGIGITNPIFKLDVRNGSINVDSVYRISTNTVLSIRGTGNLFAGNNAGRINTGINNTANGNDALYSNTEGYGNTANGFQTLYSNTTGPGNTAVGFQALYSNTVGEANTASGDFALYSNTAGKYNTAGGESALYNNIDGWYNTANGDFALFNNINGSYNTAHGGRALNGNATGNQNTAYGYWALSNNFNGTLNTGLGFNSDVFSNGLTNATAIGANAEVGCSNCLILGSVNNINGATSGVNVGIGVNSPNAKLSISTNGNELAGSATGNVLTTNGGTLSNLVNSEMSLANIGFMSTNNSSLGVRAYRTSQGSDWYSTSLLLEYDVDNTARAGGGFLAISANGNVGISTVLPQARLDVNGSTKTNSLIVTNGGNASDFLIKNDNSGQVGFRKGHVGLGLNYIIAVEGAYPSQFPPQSQGPMIGEIKIFAGNNAPYGWLFCQGQLLVITDYQDLFNIIGTTFGGNGQDNFALPNLRGAVPVGDGAAWSLGELSN